MSDGYRPVSGWDDVREPFGLEQFGLEQPPFGLGDAEPRREEAGADGNDYLCVACWEWHRGALCADERDEQEERPVRRAA